MSGNAAQDTVGQRYAWVNLGKLTLTLFWFDISVNRLADKALDRDAAPALSPTVQSSADLSSITSGIRIGHRGDALVVPAQRRPRMKRPIVRQPEPALPIRDLPRFC